MHLSDWLALSCDDLDDVHEYPSLRESIHGDTYLVSALLLVEAHPYLLEPSNHQLCSSSYRALELNLPRYVSRSSLDVSDNRSDSARACGCHLSAKTAHHDFFLPRATEPERKRVPRIYTIEYQQTERGSVYGGDADAGYRILGANFASGL